MQILQLSLAVRRAPRLVGERVRQVLPRLLLLGTDLRPQVPMSRRRFLHCPVATQRLERNLCLEMIRELPSLPRHRHVPSSLGHILAHCPIFRSKLS